MAVTNIPQKFEASDGKEFDDEVAAQKYDLLLEATREFNRARATFLRLLAESQRTADGHAFEFGLFKRHWRIVDHFRFGPLLEEVAFYGMGESYEWRDGNLEIYQRPEIASRDQRGNSYRIVDLYQDQAVARGAWLAARRRWIEAQLAELTEDEERFRPLQRESAESL